MILPRAQWQERASQHRAAVETELADVVERRSRGQRHPVDDFLFHYYNLRPRHLAAWHPGAGVRLEGADEVAAQPFHTVRDGLVEFDRDAFLARRASTVETAHRLLEASAAAPPRFGCFGMHEWAMVYRLPEHETRHPYLKLRFPPDEVARIVEETGLRCSHVDAFRFFTPDAVPLNPVQPTRERQAELDQPGCLHVNMDLYKWAGKLSPAVSSELLFETFVLAREIRVVDMRASAYDLTDWGYEPVPVETPEGRPAYADLQRDFARRAVPLRERLLEVTRTLVAAC